MADIMIYFDIANNPSKMENYIAMKKHNHHISGDFIQIKHSITKRDYYEAETSIQEIFDNKTIKFTF